MSPSGLTILYSQKLIYMTMSQDLSRKYESLLTGNLK